MTAWSKRVTAIAFIVLIILGNIWLIGMFTGEQAPAWTATGFLYAIALAAIGGVGMLIGRLTGSNEDPRS
jgi:hypothetical protein